MAPSLQFVGGFLGAEKTTPLRAAARVLAARGERVALITQPQRLVPTHRLGLRVLRDDASCAPIERRARA